MIKLENTKTKEVCYIESLPYSYLTKVIKFYRDRECTNILMKKTRKGVLIDEGSETITINGDEYRYFLENDVDRVSISTLGKTSMMDRNKGRSFSEFARMNENDLKDIMGGTYDPKVAERILRNLDKEK